MRHRSTREHELPDTASRTRQELIKLSFAMTRTTPLPRLLAAAFLAAAATLPPALHAEPDEMALTGA